MLASSAGPKYNHDMLCEAGTAVHLRSDIANASGACKKRKASATGDVPFSKCAIVSLIEA